MRIIHPTVQAIVDSGNYVSFVLIKMEMQNGTSPPLCYTGHSYNLTYDGNVYLADNPIVSVEPPLIESGTDREPFKLVLADPTFSMRDDVESSAAGVPGWSGARVTMFYGVCDSNGTPILDTDKVFIGFTGMIDTAAYAVDPVEGTVLLTLECTSPLASLDYVNSFVTSQNFIKKKDPTDTCFDFAHVTSGELNMKWGRI